MHSPLLRPRIADSNAMKITPLLSANPAEKKGVIPFIDFILLLPGLCWTA